MKKKFKKRKSERVLEAFRPIEGIETAVSKTSNIILE